MRPQSSAQGWSPGWVEFSLVSLEYYIDVNVFIAIVVEFPLDEYGIEVKGVTEALEKQLADYIGNSASV